MRIAILMILAASLGLGARDPKPAPQAEKKAAEEQKAPAEVAAPATAATAPDGSSAVDPGKLAAPAAAGAGSTAPINQKTYIIGAEDVVRVIVWANPGLSGDFMVRPDGAISLPLVGDIQVAERTPQQVEALVTQTLKDKKLMLDPHVSIGLAAVHSKKYYIPGEVNKPGAYDLVVPLTVMEALVQAGGFRDFANTKKIRIQRGGKEFKFNYNWVSHGKHLELNIYLEPRDIIIVP